jgi:hypothetical protein
MKASSDKDFARFVEKNAEAMRAITSGSSSDLGVWWVVLAYIFEFNGLYVYDTDDGAEYHESYEFERYPLKGTLRNAELTELMKAAFKENKPQSREREERLNGNTLRVEAVAAIPLVIDNAKKILVICKQLEKPKDEVAEGYVFDSYKLHLYLPVIKNFILAHEQRRQLVQSKSIIKFGTMAAIAAGVLALMEGLSSTIDLFKGASFLEVAGGLGIIGVLVFVGTAILQMAISGKTFNLKQLFEPFIEAFRAGN